MKQMMTVICSATLAACGSAPAVQPQSEYQVMTISTTDRELQTIYSAAIRGRQDIDRAILLLSGKMEQRTGALSGTFHPASSGERITFSDNLQQSEKSGALCGWITFFIPDGHIR